MSYVNKKIRVFKEAGDVEIHRKRSDGRMKTYLSATDARAWCDSTEQRRQHILDLIRQGDGKGLSLGKYIPIEAIIDILLANKNEDIRRLQREIEELKKFIKDNGLTYEEKPLKVIEGAGSGPALGAGSRSPDEGIDDMLGEDGRELTDEERAQVAAERAARAKQGAKDGGHEETSSTPMPTDSSDYDEKSPRYPIEDEKAAAALLAGKSPEDQLAALKEALADTESTYSTQHDLALEAIEKLEAIKDIVDGVEGTKERAPRRPSAVKSLSGGSARRPSKSYDSSSGSCIEEIDNLEREIQAMKLSSSPESEIIQREVQVLKKYCAQLSAIQRENTDLKKERDSLRDGLGADDGMKDKLNKLDEVTQERDRLRARVQQLEQELSGYGNLPQQVDNFRDKAQVLDSLRADESDLRKRLDNLAGLEDEVRRLKKKADECVQPAGDSNERDKLLAKIAELERELDNCKCKLKEIEMLKVERNCLKMRLDDLAKIQTDYEELLKKTQGFEAQKAECAMYKAKYEELKNLEAECNELRAKVQRVEELENERQLLMKEIEDCECCMGNQENEIKRLACHIECLSQDLDKRQDQMKTKVLTMRAHIEKKDCIIAKSEQQLAGVQDQLRDSIEQLSCETTCLRNRIEELEAEVGQHEINLAKRDERCKALECSVKMLDANNKSLLEKVELEKNNNAKLEDALKKSIRSDDHLKQMLKQAKCAIKCIMQKLAKQDLIGEGRLDAERENYLKKMKEMEQGIGEQTCGSDRIAELEQELLKANAANKSLRDNLDQLKGIIEENDTLRKLAEELQAAAKTQVTKLEDTNETLSRKSQENEGKCEELRQRLTEKDQMISELRQKLADLQRQLEVAERRQQEAENAIISLSQSGDVDAADLAKLKAQMNVLNAENDRLSFDLANQKKECEDTIKKLKAKMEQLERDAERIKRLEDENTDASTDASRFKKESDLLKAELEKLRDKLAKSEDEGGRLRDEMTDANKWKKENEVLKNELDKLREKQERCDAELAKLKGELAAKAGLEADNKMLQDEVNKLKEVLQDAGSKSKDEAANKGLLESEKKNLQDELNKLKQDVAAKNNVETENKALKDALEKLQQDLGAKGTLEKENKTLKDEINALKQELGSKSALEKENKDLKDELNKLKQECASKGGVENENKSLKDELAKLKQECASKGDVEGENKNLNDQINKLKQEASAAKQDASSAQQELAKAKQDLAALKQELDKLNKELAALQKEVSSKGNVEDENKNLKDELNNLKKELASRPAAPAEDKENKFAQERDDLLKQIAAQKKEIGDLVEKIKTPAKTEDATPFKELENKNKENEKLKSTIEDLEQKLKDLQKAQMDVPKGSPEIEKTVNDLKNSLEKEEKKAADLEDQLKKCQENNASLKKQIAELQAQAKKKSIEKEVKPVETARAPKADGDRVKDLEAELAKRKKECNDMIASLKDQYDRDIKNIQNQNQAAIDKLQKAHQDALNKISEQHETESSKLKQELRKQESVSSKEKKEEPVQEEKPRKLSVRTFGDVCICGKLPAVIPIAPMEMQKPASEPCTAPCSYPDQQLVPCISIPPCMETRSPMLTSRSSSPSKDEKVSSIKKIVELENKLLVKQQHTKQKIDTLQSTVDKFKRELELERQRNSDLVSRYTNQSKTVDNMKVEIDLWKRENIQHKKMLQRLNTKLRTIGDVSGPGVSHQCPPCPPNVTNFGRTPAGLPYFHTELTLVKDNDNRYKHNCVMKRTSCSCAVGDRSSDSFEIGPRNTNNAGEEQASHFEGGELQVFGDARQNSEEKVKRQQDYEKYVLQQDEEIQKLKFQLANLSQNAQQDQKIRSADVGLSNVKNFDTSSQSRVTALERVVANRNKINEALFEKLKTEKYTNEKLKEAIKKITKNYKELVAESRKKQLQVEELEDENENLSEEVFKCEEYITNQVEEMRRIASYIDGLTEIPHQPKKLKNDTNHSKRSGKCEKNLSLKRISELDAKVKDYKAALRSERKNRRSLREKLECEKKTKLKMEAAFVKMTNIYENVLKQNEEFDIVKDQFTLHKNECDDLKKISDSFETDAVKMSQLEREKRTLKNQIHNCNCLNAKQRDKLAYKDQQIESLQTKLESQILSNQVLSEDLEKEGMIRSQSEAAVEKVRGENKHLNDMLTYARCTLLCITQRLEKCELERQQLQNEKINAETCNCLQLQDKDKEFEHLKTELMDLRQRLVNEQTLRQNAEIILADVKAFGDTQMNVIEELSREIDRLCVELGDDLKPRSAGRLTTQVKNLETENIRLIGELQNLLKCLDCEPSEVTKLRTQLRELCCEVKLQKQQLDEEKQLRADAEKQLKLKTIQEEENSKKIQQSSPEGLAETKDPKVQTVILLERAFKDDTFEYRYLCGFSDKKSGSGGEMEINDALQRLENENRNLKGQLKTLNQQLESKLSQIKDDHFAEERDTLTKQIDVQKKEIVELLLKINQLSRKDDVQRELEQKNEENEKLRHSINSLEKQLLDAVQTQTRTPSASSIDDKENVQFKELLQLAQKRIFDLEETLALCENKTTSMGRQIVDLRDENSSLRSELEVFKASRLEGNVADKPTVPMEKLQSIQKRLQECQNDNKALIEEVEKLKTPLEVKQKSSCQELEKLLDVCKEQSLELQKKVDYLMIRSPSRSQKFGSEQEEIEMLEAKIVELQSEIGRLKAVPRDVEESVDDDDIKEKNLRDLVEYIKELERKNEHLKSKTVQLELENGRLRNDLKRIAGEGHQTLQNKLEKLGDFEKQIALCLEKNEHLKARIKQLENEARSIKKEYIDALIAKEKLSLLNNEQNQRLRETIKLLDKCQEKKQNMSTKFVDCQIQNENLRREIFELTGKEVHIRAGPSYENLRSRNDLLEAQIDELKRLVENIEDIPEDDFKGKIDALEIENQNVKRELAGIKGKDVDSNDEAEESDHKRDNLQLDAIELEIENEHLKKEISHKEKIYGIELKNAQKRINELEEQLHELKEMHDYFKAKNIEITHDNEYLKKEIDRISIIQNSMESDSAKVLQVKQLVRDYESPSSSLRRERKSIIISADRVRELEDAVKTSNTEIESLKKEIERLRKEKDSVPEQLNESLIEEKSRNEELMNEVQRFLKINKLQGKLNSNLEKQLKEAQMKVEKLSKTKRVSFHDLGQLLDDDSKLRISKSELEVLQRKSEQLDEMAEAIEKQQRRIDDLEQQLEQCRFMNRKLKKQLGEPVDEKSEGESSKPGKDKERRDDKDGQRSEADAETEGSSATEVEVEYAALKQMQDKLIAENITLKSDMAKETQKLETLAKGYESKTQQLKQEIIVLHRQLASKHMTEQENKRLKNQVNGLKQDLQTRTQEYNNLRDELNKLRTAKDELLSHIDSEQNEIDDLKSKIESLGGGEDDRNEKEMKLKSAIAKMSDQIENLKKRQSETGKGDTDDKCSRKLEAILQKYRDNNASLKMRIMKLEIEKDGLKSRIAKRIEREETSTDSDAQLKRMRKLEEVLQKYQDSNEYLKKKVASFEGKRMQELEEEVNRCKENNKNLKTVTSQLEAEVKYLKDEIEAFVDGDRKERTDDSLTMTWGQRRVTKSCGTSPEALQTMNMQPMMQPMPMFLPYCNYMLPQSAATEPKTETASTDLHQLSYLIEKIQNTLEQSKQVVDAEREESEERVVDFSGYETQTTTSPSENASSVTSAPGPSSSLSSEMSEQVVRQQRTKEKMDRLRRTIDTTMKQLEKESQKYECYAKKHAISSSRCKHDKKNPPGCNVCLKHKKETVAEKTNTKVVGRSSEVSGSTYSPASKPGPSNKLFQESTDRKRFHVSFISEHSSHYSVGHGSFDCLQK